MRRKKRFADRTPIENTLVGIVFLASPAIGGLAERDIRRRPESGVRGPKLAWRLASLNAVGALGYPGLGRRQGPRRRHCRVTRRSPG